MRLPCKQVCKGTECISGKESTRKISTGTDNIIKCLFIDVYKASILLLTCLQIVMSSGVVTGSDDGGLDAGPHSP